MDYLKEAFECSVEELDRELIARGARIPGAQWFGFGDIKETPQGNEIMANVITFYREKSRSLTPDESLSHISTEELVKVLLFKTGRIEIGGVR
jgi:hypothetical protein